MVWQLSFLEVLSWYERFVFALEEASRDMLPVLKDKALKLGDQNRGASNADFYLSNLLFLSPKYEGCEQSTNAVNFLSQIRPSIKGDGPAAEKRSIDVYFAPFKVLITEAESTRGKEKSGRGENRNDSRLLSALLIEVNRAFPFVSSTEADDISLRSKHQFFSDWSSGIDAS
ncbi:CCAAT-binding factor [Euphorbia peplus]|nr:CCAAT-binding factor [Euphorbia peplus]